MAEESEPGFVFTLSAGPHDAGHRNLSKDGGVFASLGPASAAAWPGRELLGDEPSVASDASLLVVVQGMIDYREALGVAPSGASAAEVMRAAFARWGRAVVDKVEGDYSAIIWDDATGSLLVYRTFPGPYPLYYASQPPDPFTAVWSSTARGVLRETGAEVSLNVTAVAEAAGGLLFGEHGETCLSGVQLLNPGWASVQQIEAPPQRFQAWKPSLEMSKTPLSDASKELMDLLRAAVHERLAWNAKTGVWLSGGFDSSAVFAAAMAEVSSQGSVRPSVIPISITYPEGDVGREDGWIEATTARWNTTPRWVDSEGIAVRTDFEESARTRDLPFVHLFDTWNEALARSTHDADARVALGGDGGDQLFQSAPIHLADLARKGRAIATIREYRSLGGRSMRGLVRWSLAPLLPRVFARIYEGFSGNPYQDTLRVAPPAWLDTTFVRAHGLLERNRETSPRYLGASRTAREVFRLASSPFFGRVATEVRQAARRCGVLHRSPLWDRRIVEFALGRPFSERVAQGESKILLRAAMQGLVPDEVLAPRPQRTGAPDSVFHRFMSEGVLPAVERLGDLDHLAGLGIVDPDAFREGVLQYRSFPAFFLGVQIAFSVDTECWLRGLA